VIFHEQHGEGLMSLKVMGSIVVAAAVTLAVGTADAATTKRKPTRVVVTKRSYLDGGTTPNPGERLNFYDIYPTTFHRPYSVVDPTGATRWPLPDPFWLPGSTSSFGY
jgi:hypothetical protein